MKRIFLSSVLCLAFAGIASAGQNEVLPYYAYTAKAKAAVLYAGRDGDFLVFKVSIDNAAKEKARLTVRNGAGDELYSETITGHKVERVIKIGAQEESGVEFLVNAGSLSFSKKFTIDTKYIRQVLVAEAK